MFEAPDSLVLEVSKYSDTLKMSVFERKDISQTLRHYSQLPVNFLEINKICSEISEILNKENSRPELEKAGQLLWDHLLTRNIKDKLRSTSIKCLVLSLDEELIGIPWELLFDGRDFLALKFSLGRIVRTKEFVHRPEYRDLGPAPKMLILANPTNDLESSYFEGIHIKNRFEHKRKEIKIDFKACQIDTLYVKKNLRDYQIVHFAGHCEYVDSNVKESGWVLSDGKFSIQDIFSLGETMSLPAMVFSNACHSAEAADTRAHSIASAFLFSGVRHYIGTIRKIEDSVSLKFATEFYSQLILGKPVGECLRLARLKLVEESGHYSTSWASYLLYGDAGFTMFKPRIRKSQGAKAYLAKLKKYSRSFILAAAVFTAISLLLLWMPTLNPSAYYLFARSGKLSGKGRNEEAAVILKQAAKKDPSYLAIYPRLGQVYERMGKRQEALRHYFDYALFSSRKNNERQLVSAYISIGWLYQSMGDYNKAMDFYSKSLELSKQSRDVLSEAVALRKMAVWFTDKENYDKALELLMKSSEINRGRLFSREHKINLACDYFDIGLIFANKDDFKAAREFYGKSLTIFKKMNLRNEMSDCYFNEGEMFLFEKQYQKALDCYIRGLKIDELHDNKPSLAVDYEMIGNLYKEMGDYDSAENYFLRSIELSKEINAPIELASASFSLGLLYKEQGFRNKAREYMRQAQEIYSRIDTPDYKRVKQALLE